MDASIRIHEDTLGGKALRTVIGHSIAEIEVAMPKRIASDFAVRIETGLDVAILTITRQRSTGLVLFRP